MSWSLSWLRRFCLNALMSSIAITVINASVLIALATESVAQSVPPDLPLAIICWNEGVQTWGIAYLATVRKDGSATYLPPTGQLAATVNAKRMVEPPQDRPAAFDCFGKTLDELRAIDRIIEFQRSR